SSITRLCVCSRRFIFYFTDSGAHRDLPSFPTRRSSDLPCLGRRGRRLRVSSQRNRRGRSRRGGSPRLCCACRALARRVRRPPSADRKSTRLNSSHVAISYAVFCLKKKI